MSIDEIQVFRFLDKNNTNKIRRFTFSNSLFRNLKPRKEINYMIKKLPDKISLNEYKKIIDMDLINILDKIIYKNENPESIIKYIIKT